MDTCVCFSHSPMVGNLPHLLYISDPLIHQLEVSPKQGHVHQSYPNVGVYTFTFPQLSHQHSLQLL